MRNGNADDGTLAAKREFNLTSQNVVLATFDCSLNLAALVRLGRIRRGSNFLSDAIVVDGVIIGVGNLDFVGPGGSLRLLVCGAAFVGVHKCLFATNSFGDADVVVLELQATCTVDGDMASSADYFVWIDEAHENDIVVITDMLDCATATIFATNGPVFVLSPSGHVGI